jgi:HAD superfamily hydrolase (TIGR01509 family)
MIRAIIFDLWNTLAYNEEPNPIMELKQRFEITDLKLIEKAVMTQDFETEKEMLTAFCEFFNLVPNEKLLSELLARFRLGTSRSKIFDDVIPTMKELKKKYILCMISNTDSFSAQALRKTGLFSYIDHQCLSCDVGLIKPDPAIFELMLEKLNLNPTEVVMVGDNISDDLMPSSEIGMKTILIKRDQKFSKSHTEVGEYPQTITKLSDIKKYL